MSSGRAGKTLEAPQVCSRIKGSSIMSKFMTRFFKDESGATAIEYGLIAALVAVVLVGTLGAVGDELGKTFNSVEDGLKDANTPAAGG
jgi:pilus assembly protein Flp/PilA